MGHRSCTVERLQAPGSRLQAFGVVVFAFFFFAACSETPNADASIAGGDAGAGLDAVAHADAEPGDVPVVDLGVQQDSGQADSGEVTDAGVADTGTVNDTITLRLLHMDPTQRALDLCVFQADSHGDPLPNTPSPVFVYETLGRAQGVAFMEIGARFTFTAPMGTSWAVHVMPATETDCFNSPILSTGATSNGGATANIILFTDLPTNVVDNPPTLADADDVVWKFHAGRTGDSLDFTLTNGVPMPLDMAYAAYRDVGMLNLRDDGDAVTASRMFTPLIGGSTTILTYQPFAPDESARIVVCDDLARSIDGLTPCGDNVR